MTYFSIIYLCSAFSLLLLSGCSVNVHMSPIELSMRKCMQQEIAGSVAGAITAQIPEIKKQLFQDSTKSDGKSESKSENGGAIIVDIGEKSSKIKNSFHVPPQKFDSLAEQAELLNKETPVIIYTTTQTLADAKAAIDKLHKLGFKHVGVYSGSPEVLNAMPTAL